jgi:type II secretion system protein C
MACVIEEVRIAEAQKPREHSDATAHYAGSQLRRLCKCAQNLKFWSVFSTLRAVLRRAGLGTAIRVLHSGLIVLAAWAAAVVVLKIVSLDLHPTVQTKAPAEDAAVKVAGSKRGADDALILKRNLFGAADLDVASEEAPAAGEADLRLRGIASSEGVSFAVFENTSSGEQNVFAIGEKVFDGPKLVAVDRGGADVLLRGKKRRYEIEEENATASVDGEKKGSGGARHAALKGDSKAGAAITGVKKTGDNAYLVDRREVEHAVANLNEVITQARAVPVLADGKSTGFKLFNIRQGSIFSAIGLVDGDIVQRVNDTELTDPSKAVGLLEEIQSMGQIRVNYVRSGKLHTNTYTIR